jgi:hypothetical protein
MKKKMVITALFCILFVAAFAVDVMAQHREARRPPEPCFNTAWNMMRACKIDTREELLIAHANCANIADGEERIECRDDAEEERDEALEECDDQFKARVEVCELLEEFRYDPDPLLDPANSFIHPDEIPGTYPVNPYVSLVAGHTYVLRAGEEGEEIVIVHVTDETREIQGVDCRVVADVVLEAEEDEENGEIDYEAVEVTDDWFAQDEVGNVYYCGEVSREFEDGVLASLDGSFEAGKDYAKSGVLIKMSPVEGTAHRQEFFLEEAEDLVEYIALDGIPTEEMGGENENFPCAPGGCLQTHDSSPLEPSDTEYKFYKWGVGFVLAVALEDGEVAEEREELVCVGPTLDILLDPACEIEDPEELLEELCELSPDAFCPDDED